MGKAKVVIDTNIIISGIGWNGNPRRVLEKALNQEIEWLISTELFLELAEAMNYPKLGFSESEKEGIQSIIPAIATFVSISEKITLARDPKDDKVLECAINGQAEYIITGDKDLLELKSVKGIRILTAKEFLELIA